MIIEEREYRRLKDIERRYMRVINDTLDDAKVNVKKPGDIYLTGGVVRSEILLHFKKEYEKKRKELNR